MPVTVSMYRYPYSVTELPWRAFLMPYLRVFFFVFFRKALAIKKSNLSG